MPSDIIRQAVDSGIAELIPSERRTRAWWLKVNGLLMSFVDLRNPTALADYYSRWMAHAVDVAHPGRQALDILHLGGGGMSLARYFAATRPRSNQLVIEADGGLIAMVAKHIPLPAESGITVIQGDALTWISESGQQDTMDVVISDVFVRQNLTEDVVSPRYAAAAANIVRPGGIYLANIWDSDPSFARQLEVVQSTFAHVCTISDQAEGRERPPGRNVVIVASQEPFRHHELSRLVSPFELTAPPRGLRPSRSDARHSEPGTHAEPQAVPYGG